MTKKIKLTRGQYTLVDDEDYWLNNYNWYALKTKSGFYAARHGTLEGKFLLIHRVIMDFPELTVDHINGDTLDNRRKNLRIATQHQQMFNRKSNSNGTSKYKGVSWAKTKNK